MMENENRHAILRAELDAYYAGLYGLNRDELRYILDPKEVYGPDFPGETFRILKEREKKEFGEYCILYIIIKGKIDCTEEMFDSLNEEREKTYKI